MRKLWILILLVATGCTSPHEYVDPIDPNEVTIAELAERAELLETLYQKNHQVEGIMFQASRKDPTSDGDPDQYGNGGDSCIFGGHKLAADVFRYATLGGTANLDKALQSLRGLYILTHATGTPGVLARCAFPAMRQSEWNFPQNWQHRIDKGFVHTGDFIIYPPDPLNPIDPMIYYTRATKDQLTGLIFGLAVAWEHLEDGHFLAVEDLDSAKISVAKIIIADIVEEVYNHLEKHDFLIRDEKGENETNADDVDGLMLLQVLALYKETAYITNPGRASSIYKKYQDKFNGSFFTAGDLFHRWNNYSQYYAWNLRYLRGYTVNLLEGDTKHRSRIIEWYDDRLWQFTANHLNAKFIYMYNAVTRRDQKLKDALFAMKSLSIKPVRSYPSPLAGDERKPSFLQVTFGDWDRFILAPHLRKATNYSTWQKEPWDVGGVYDGGSNTVGVDYILAYWMGRFYNFIPAPR